MIKIEDGDVLTTRLNLLHQVIEVSLVIIHCSYSGTWWEEKIRVWKSTFLFAKGTSHRSKLIKSKNITMYPIWTKVDDGQTIHFTLIFEPLSKHCKQFDLIENIPEPGGFEFMNIQKNNSMFIYWI